jgi:hypothetical protein
MLRLGQELKYMQLSLRSVRELLIKCSRGKETYGPCSHPECLHFLARSNRTLGDHHERQEKCSLAAADHGQSTSTR